ncbi:MAG: phosphoglycerate kinase [Candidatus Woesearchaeota archaeon]|nr:MAG: phosphoglycerate kinase [Candidatus Woesearchaeota archaeon]
MYDFFSIDNFSLKGKTLGVRVDFSAAIVDYKPVMNERIAAHLKTVEELSALGAKQVLLSHQGRSQNKDFQSLKDHIPMLEKELKKNIKFIPELTSQKVFKAIKELKEGEILLLENLRFCPHEEHPPKKENLFFDLEKHFDYYILDAFSLAHLSNSSITEIKNIPLLAGRVMENEVTNLHKLLHTKKPRIMVLGGDKIEETVSFVQEILEKKLTEHIALTGVIGYFALYTQGYRFGKLDSLLSRPEFANKRRTLHKILQTYKTQISLPIDIGLINKKTRLDIPLEKLSEEKTRVMEAEHFDLGIKSAHIFRDIILKGEAVFMHGPSGEIENPLSQSGTQILLKALCTTKAFTILVGGHTLTALQKFSEKEKSSINFVSAGGASLFHFLTEQDLVGLKALEKSYDTFNCDYPEFLCLGSNVLDTTLGLDKYYSQIQLGEKVKIEKDFEKSIGGGGVNVSIALKKLGAKKVAYLGKLAQETKDPTIKNLKENNVEVIPSIFSSESAAKSIVIDTLDKDRIIFTHRGQNSQLKWTDFRESDSIAKYYYFSSLGGESFKTQLRLAKELSKNKRKTLLCYNPSAGLVKGEKKLKELIALTNILILNFEEAKLLSKKQKITDCLKTICAMGPQIVVITDGSRGSYAYDKEKEYYCPAKKVKEVIDTTGAGDCFTATFFYFYAHGFGINLSLHFASLHSAQLIQHRGSQQGLLNKEELLKIQ